MLAGPIRRLGVLALALCAWGATAAWPARADELIENSMIDIEYKPPSNPNYKTDFEIVQRTKTLEQLQAFLSPLRLPRRLAIETSECGVTNAFYSPANTRVYICYEWINWVRRLAPIEMSDYGVSRDSAIVGAFVQVVLHELGHAVIHLLRVPVFGREEDAADQIAGFLMLQFGKENARRTLSGTAYFWESLIDDSFFQNKTSFADVHGTDAQRFYNYLCIAYGGDPVTFKDYVDKGILPQARAQTCAAEYQQIYYAFGQTIAKYIDFKLAREVQMREWLPPPPR